MGQHRGSDALGCPSERPDVRRPGRSPDSDGTARDAGGRAVICRDERLVTGDWRYIEALKAAVPGPKLQPTPAGAQNRRDFPESSWLRVSGSDPAVRFVTLQRLLDRRE